LYQWGNAGGINVTSTSLPFFTQLVPNATVGYYPSSSVGYASLVSAVTNYADGFVLLVQKYTPSDGQLSEQYLKSNGTPTSAIKLTWSFASALTAFDSKSNFLPASWGASGLETANCGTTVAVTFNEYATTVLGESIYIVGSISRMCVYACILHQYYLLLELLSATELSNWDTSKAILLSSANYPTWSVTLNIPADRYFEYKYIRIDNGAGE